MLNNTKSYVLTLVYIHQSPRLLLAQKKRGFGMGKWNGFGGKLDNNESVIDAAVRETKEESGLTPINLVKVGYLEFDYQPKNEFLKVNIFKTSEFDGEIKETEEMKPQWFNENELPYNDMWADDKHWLPLLLANKKFKGKFTLGEGEILIDKELEEVTEL